MGQLNLGYLGINSRRPGQLEACFEECCSAGIQACREGFLEGQLSRHYILAPEYVQKCAWPTLNCLMSDALP